MKKVSKKKIRLIETEKPTLISDPFVGRVTKKKVTMMLDGEEVLVDTYAVRYEDDRIEVLKEALVRSSGSYIRIRGTMDNPLEMLEKEARARKKLAEVSVSVKEGRTSFSGRFEGERPFHYYVYSETAQILKRVLPLIVSQQYLAARRILVYEAGVPR